MGCSYSTITVNDNNKRFKNDKKWERLATFGTHLKTRTWGKEIVCMDTLHPKLFMGSRLSAQQVIDNAKLLDTNGIQHDTKNFFLVCVASGRTCEYCVMSNKYKAYDMQDRNKQSDDFLDTAVKTAKHIHSKLIQGKSVLVHCHSGRNRSALVMLVYAAMYTDLPYEKALYQIKKHNSKRFDMQSTLQNNQFTYTVSNNWNTLNLMRKNRL